MIPRMFHERRSACVIRILSVIGLLGCASTTGFDNPATVEDADGGAAGKGFANVDESATVLERFGFAGAESTGGAFPTGGTASCDAGNVIYVFAVDETLARFDPQSYAVSTIGRISCPGQTSTPNSMAVDRDGNAWVGYHNGAIYKVSTTDATCTESGYVGGQAGWLSFGMAFVADPSTTPPTDTLYLADGDSLNGDTFFNAGLGRVDPVTLELSVIGQFGSPIAGLACELTGLANGTLNALCPSSPTSIARVQTSDASVVSEVKLPLGKVGSFAFAQWGGSYFVFTSVVDGQNSRVDRYVPNVGMKRVVDDAGLQIIGAGVSTCAPDTVD